MNIDYSSSSDNRLPALPPHHMLAQLERAILAGDQATVRGIVEQLDLLSANECLRLLGEEWGFPTVEVQGQRLMATRDLAWSVYGYANPGNLLKVLARYGREPLNLQRYNTKYKTLIRAQLGFSRMTKRAFLATWVDVLIIGMRGHTAGAKRIQEYLLKAERENRIHWTVEQLQQGAGEMLRRVADHLERPVQINWSKRRNDLLFREGISFNGSWTHSHEAHTELTTEQLRAIGEAHGIKDTRRPGERLSVLKVIRDFMPEAASSISAESEYMVRGIPQSEAERITIAYVKPLALELRKYNLRMQEEVDFAHHVRDVEDEL